MSEQVEILTENELKEIKSNTEGKEVDEFEGYDPVVELRPRMMLFIENYMLGEKGVRYNATESYLLAYGDDNRIDKSVVMSRSTAQVNGGRLLGKQFARKYQRFIMRSTGFNDESVDNKLKDNIFESNGRDSTVAIREYNKVKGRHVNKNVNITVDANRLLDQLGGGDGDDY